MQCIQYCNHTIALAHCSRKYLYKTISKISVFENMLELHTCYYESLRFYEIYSNIEHIYLLIVDQQIEIAKRGDNSLKEVSFKYLQNTNNCSFDFDVY